MLSQGEKVPDFSLEDQQGSLRSLQHFSGKKIVMYFYPKDDTSGCTKEACSIRDVYDDILETGAVVVGVSPDGIKSHARFVEKYGLPFYLLADTDHTLAEAMGVWAEKKMYGKSYMGILRTTFLINAQGIIMKVWPKVKPEGHGEEILSALKEA